MPRKKKLYKDTKQEYQLSPQTFVTIFVKEEDEYTFVGDEEGAEGKKKLNSAVRKLVKSQIDCTLCFDKSE